MKQIELPRLACMCVFEYILYNNQYQHCPGYSRVCPTWFISNICIISLYYGWFQKFSPPGYLGASFFSGFSSNYCTNGCFVNNLVGNSDIIYTILPPLQAVTVSVQGHTPNTHWYFYKCSACSFWKGNVSYTESKTHQEDAYSHLSDLFKQCWTTHNSIYSILYTIVSEDKWRWKQSSRSY